MWGSLCPTYIINLSSSHERWKKSLHQCKTINVNPIRIDAIKGSTLKKSERQVEASLSCAKFCPNASIGVTLSHMKAWSTAHVEHPNLPCMICEDDVVFTQNFFDLFLLYSQEVPQDWDILYVGCLMCQPNLPLIPKAALTLMNQKNKMSRRISEQVIIPEFAFGSHCYCVSPKGLRKLLQWNIVTEQVDFF